MIEKLNTDNDYSEALKAALIMRLNGSATRTVDDALGLIIYNIARWAVAERDILWREKPDVISDVNLRLLTKLHKIDTTQPAKRILVYLKTAASNAHKNILESNGRQKRTGEVVDIANLAIPTDIRGERIY